MSERLVVIIDDDEMFLMLAGTILEGAGYKVHTISDSVAARSYIMSGAKPAVIIVDVMMPDLKGDEVARLLKENAATAAIPILFASGMSMEELDELVRETGANGYLAKPFSFDQLVDSVRSIISQSSR
ncbi:MAG TPA: response regulator [Geobacteraceae bacterium]